MADVGIVRNRAKFNAAIGNARAWLELDDPVAVLWAFTAGVTIQNRWTSMGDVPAETTASASMSKELKRLGFRFVGPTICYAFMQATGMVNDHVVGCFRHDECAALS
jgi:DNA-3-methyladenine glycosylase I